MPPITLPTSSNPGRYGADGNARLINCQPESRGTEGKSAYGLYASYGLKQFADLTGGGAYRGGIVVDNNAYVVSGRQVFKIDAGGGFTALGGFSGDGIVYMERNQATPVQIMLVSQGRRAMIENDVLSAIEDPDLLSPNSVAFLNQYFIATRDDGRFQWSALNNGREWNSLDFATAEHSADRLLRAVVRANELLLFGTETIEPWYNPAAGNQTFARSGTVIKRGCLTGASVASIGDVPIYVDADETVRIVEGYQTRKISNNAVVRAIRDTSDQSLIEAYTYEQDDHSYYVLGGVDFCWQYDFTEPSWFERKSFQLPRWRGRGALSFAGKQIVGDYYSPKLYELDNETTNEAGDDLIMTVWIPLHAFPQKLILDTMRIDTVPGLGTYTLDPAIMVRLSRDGGKTFGNERRMGMGLRGDYNRQVRINMGGMSNEDGFVVSLSASADVCKAIIAASGEWRIMGN